jgi:tRNA threonylcarbamoyl adenosine modification protein (Sua5/YciO/YrdC/YwlC family)
MDAIVYKVRDYVGRDILSELSALVADGRAFVFPTDTVYGVGAIVADPAVVPRGLAQVFELKERELTKPLPLLIPGIGALKIWAVDVPDYALDLAEKHWPGALTLIVKANPRVNPALTNRADGSVALRVPGNDFLLELLCSVGREAALLATSANVSGGEPACDVSELDARLRELTVIVDGGRTDKQPPSTIISCLGDSPVIVRGGPIAMSLKNWASA